ncbi:MAG: LacI family DNA-binding transcriptional regulator, partial [Lentisphaeria bacterium]|nr:LacI family DNA-binding transcriptional regulator [Lentisphaeria bacterium]
MSITMEELAKLANVSQGAVSLVLNGKAKGQISQKKQDLIRALAKEHNYRINMAAKGLRQRQHDALVAQGGLADLPYLGAVLDEQTHDLR